jgi:hypothetical protein
MDELFAIDAEARAQGLGLAERGSPLPSSKLGEAMHCALGL